MLHSKDFARYSTGTSNPWSKSKSVTDNDVSLAVKMLGNQSTEVGLVILDTVEVFIHDFMKTLAEQGAHNETMRQVFVILYRLLDSRQSKHLLQHLFATLQGFVNKFPSILFTGTTEYCTLLCQQVFKYCCSPDKQTRETSSAFLYLLMRKNFEDKESGPGFARVKVQATIALSEVSCFHPFVFGCPELNRSGSMV
jgi:hypothetical protein